jgi:hypothetical protein
VVSGGTGVSEAGNSAISDQRVPHVPDAYHAVWKLTDEAVGYDGVLRKSKVKEVLPAGIIKSTSPVPPVEPATKDVGKLVAGEGALVIPPDFKRI